MADDLGTLRATITADATQFSNAIKKSQQELTGFVKQAGRDIKAIQKTFDRLAGLGVGGIIGSLAGGGIGGFLGQFADEQLGITDKIKSAFTELKDILTGADLAKEQGDFRKNHDEVLAGLENERNQLIARNIEIEKGTEAAKKFLEIEKLKLNLAGGNISLEEKKAARLNVEDAVKQNEALKRQAEAKEKEAKMQANAKAELDKLGVAAETAGMTDIEKKLFDLKNKGLDNNQLMEAERLLMLAKERADVLEKQKKNVEDEKRAMEEQAKAQENLQKEMQRDADKIKADLRNPEQVFADAFKNLLDLRNAGFLDEGQFQQAARAEGAKLNKEEPQLNQALLSGSAEAFSAIARFRAGGQQQNPADIALKQLDQERRIADGINRIEKLMEKEEVKI